MAYSNRFRQEVLRKYFNGVSPTQLSREYGISIATIYLWKRQVFNNRKASDIKFDLIGSRIRLAREASGWNMVDLAKQSGVERSLICRIETFVNKGCSARSAYRLAKALGVRLEWLIAGEGDPYPEHMREKDRLFSEN